jgi:hypothetical protein
MNTIRSFRGIAIPLAIAVVLVAAAAVAAGTGLIAPRPAAQPSASPSSPPASRPPSGGPATPASPTPSAPPASAPPATHEPTDPGPPSNDDDASDGVDVVDLVNLPGVASGVVVWDETDTLADASSGRPTPGHPVPAGTIRVEATGATDTIRLRWSDLPLDSTARLAIRIDPDGTYRMTLFRDRPAAPNDGVVSDRVLVLRFHVSVPVESVKIKLVEGLSPSAAIGYASAGLATSDGTGLSVAVWDETEGLGAVRIVDVDDKATVSDRKVRVVNRGPDTLRVTWADPEMAGDARLSVRMSSDGTYVLRLVRDRIQGTAQPVALDRVVDLAFLVAVDAADVRVELIDNLVTAS